MSQTDQIERHVMMAMLRLLAIWALGVLAVMILLSRDPALSLLAGSALSLAGAFLLWVRGHGPDPVTLPALPGWLPLQLPPLLPLERQRGAFSRVTRRVLLKTAPKLALIGITLGAAAVLVE
ncbi:MAG: hypothetical protein Alpg2KO_25580 [Alphaproteobacteria bacterium]